MVVVVGSYEKVHVGTIRNLLRDWTPTVWQHVQGIQGDSQNHVHAAMTERFLP